MAINTVIHTNAQSIDRVLNTGLPVVLVFWHRDREVSGDLDAELDNLAARHAGKLLIAKVNAYDEKPLVDRFQISVFPAFVFNKQQQVEATVPGSITPQTLRGWVEYLVKGGPRPPLSTVKQDAQQATATQHTTNGHYASNGSGAATNGSSVPIVLTDASFRQAVSGPRPVLVDFWASWCGPCRMVAPSVEQLAKEFKGRAVVAKLNVDENPVTAREYNVMSIPTLLIFKKGAVVDQIVGAQPLPVLRQRLAKVVG